MVCSFGFGGTTAVPTCVGTSGPRWVLPEGYCRSSLLCLCCASFLGVSSGRLSCNTESTAEPVAEASARRSVWGVHRGSFAVRCVSRPWPCSIGPAKVGSAGAAWLRKATTRSADRLSRPGRAQAGRAKHAGVYQGAGVEAHRRDLRPFPGCSRALLPPAGDDEVPLTAAEEALRSG
jgi:hypothetical protein